MAIVFKFNCCTPEHCERVGVALLVTSFIACFSTLILTLTEVYKTQLVLYIIVAIVSAPLSIPMLLYFLCLAILLLTFIPVGIYWLLGGEFNYDSCYWKWVRAMRLDGEVRERVEEEENPSTYVAGDLV